LEPQTRFSLAGRAGWVNQGGSGLNSNGLAGDVGERVSSQLLRAENRFAWAYSLCSSQVSQEALASAMQWADTEITGLTRCAMPQISPAHRSGRHAT
jgi:hypothetical protein